MVSVTATGWRTAYAGIVAPEHLGQLPLDRWRHEIRVGIRRPLGDAFTCVAEIDGEFAGYVYVAAPSRDADLGPEVAELVALYVDPEHWSKGVGDALMRAALERLGDLPYTEVVLWTFKGNDRAITFYERRGWRADGSERMHPRAQALSARYRHTA